MITKMTQEQESKVSNYYEKWLKNGLRTDPLTFDATVAEIRWIYATFLKEISPEPLVFLVDSPLAALVVANGIKLLLKAEPKELRSQLDSQLGSQLWSQLGSQLDSQLWSQLRSQLDSQLDSQLGSQLGSQLDSQLWSQLGSQLDSQLGSQLRSQLRSQLDSQLRSQLWSSRLEWFETMSPAWWWAGFYGFYDFVLEELMPEKRAQFSLFDRTRQFVQHIPWFIPLQGICIVSRRPTEIHFGAARANGIRPLHHESQMAVKFADGWGSWALNGVRLPKEIITTPVAELDPKAILKLGNAEQRKEGIRKIGIDRMRDPLKVQVLDTFRDYELWTIEFEGRRIGPYLKMLNPSTGQIHVEGVGKPTGGVDPEIKTCQEALAWRNGMKVYSEPKWLS